MSPRQPVPDWAVAILHAQMHLKLLIESKNNVTCNTSKNDDVVDVHDDNVDDDDDTTMDSMNDNYKNTNMNMNDNYKNTNMNMNDNYKNTNMNTNMNNSTLNEIATQSQSFQVNQVKAEYDYNQVSDQINQINQVCQVKKMVFIEEKMTEMKRLIKNTYSRMDRLKNKERRGIKVDFTSELAELQRLKMELMKLKEIKEMKMTRRIIV